MSVSVITDSVASLPADLAASLGIGVVSLYVNEGERSFADADLAPDEFYRHLTAVGPAPTSSQPSVESLVEAFRAAASQGADVVGVFISEKMSGTLQTARMAAEMVREQSPGVDIELIDSRSNSMQEGFCAIAAARAAQAGRSLEECVRAAQETIRRTRYLFAPESLDYLRRGGRIGAASALLGGLLQIKPILTVANGETTTFARVRTHRKALEQMAAQFATDVGAKGLVDAVVHYIGERDPAERYAAEQIGPVAGRAIEVLPVSPVIGVHVGPAIGLVYRTEKELDA